MKSRLNVSLPLHPPPPISPPLSRPSLSPPVLSSMIRVPKPPSIRSMSNMDGGDPLAAIIRPPSSESDEERQLRLQREAEAKKISDRIDEEISQDEKRFKKQKQDIKLLLLGQAESGKSTLQKQFQLMYNPTSLEEERLSWRAVVYYNTVMPLRRIFEALEIHGAGEDEESSAKISYGTPDAHSRVTASSPQFDSNASDQDSSFRAISLKSDIDNQLVTYRLRLGPLLATESSLADRLSGGVAVSGSGKGSVFVRSGWQSRGLGLPFGKRNRGNSSSRFSFPGRSSVESTLPRSSESKERVKDSLIEDIARVLDACKDDVRDLWEHPAVKSLRERRKLRLEEWGEFFLDNIMRVASDGYVPTTDDILHARIQTMGVAEHVFLMDVHGRQAIWHLFDVGGARGQRHTWIPYFDDANAIIFLAPVSAYDQYLEEDPRTNRIDDSLQLFTHICAHPLLKKVHLVLFLNKTDVLKAKIDKGIQVKKYITSYGDRPLEFDSVVNYFKTHFTQVHKRNNDNKRVLYTHLTSVVDTKATKSIIHNVSDSIFRKYLEEAALV